MLPMWSQIARLLVLLALGGVIPSAASWAIVVDNGGAFSWPLPDWMPPPSTPADNPMLVAKVELGRYLFFDVRLAGLNIKEQVAAKLELSHPNGLWVLMSMAVASNPVAAS